MSNYWTIAYFLIKLISSTVSTCFEPSTAFPVPSWPNGKHDLAPAFSAIGTGLDGLVANKKYDAVSISVEITSQSESLWSHFHTARKQNSTRPGASVVDGDSLYRIASITKTFTVLGLLYQHEAGNLNLETPIKHYIPELTGSIPWHDITLRALASQLSGIPRDFAQSDLLLELPDPTAIGLPPASKENLVRCDEYADFDPPCNETDLISWLNKAVPTFAPNQKSTYSNIAYELIGLAIARATNQTFESYIQDSILHPLNMTLSSFATPDDTHAVLPLGPNYWGIDEGVQNPTGGLYSSSADMSKFLRYVLTHYNAIATGINWLFPASWGGSTESFYGMPWEIFRTDRILEDSRRPVTFATKGGGLPGYVTLISVLPEYGLGVTVLVAFQDTPEILNEVQNLVTTSLVRAAEAFIWQDVEKVYDGTYTALDKHLNSTLELASSPSTGLIVNTFISNSTDILNHVAPGMFGNPTRAWRLQLFPTLLFKDEKKQEGEIFRLAPFFERDGKDRGAWDDFCFTEVDGQRYAGLPINEVVFWHERGDVEMPAWKVVMRRSENDEKLVVQG